LGLLPAFHVHPPVIVAVLILAPAILGGAWLAGTRNDLHEAKAMGGIFGRHVHSGRAGEFAPRSGESPVWRAAQNGVEVGGTERYIVVRTVRYVRFGLAEKSLIW
jgi:hypothetical protein